ncbi:MAG: SDR family NAD(P)-dependent oxidoreductase [Roseovarius sp.]
MQTLEGKTAIVTGASAPSGIGRAAALELASEGARVVVTDIAGTAEGGTADKLELLQALAAQISGAGGQALALELDVTRREDAARCMERTAETFGGLDILVNNAASLVGTGAFIDSRPEDWTLSYEVNLLGVVLMCQAAIPLLRERGGAIINIGSTGSLGAEPGFGAYTTMKHGLIGLTKTIAAEHGVDGIRCNAVCPGYTETDMHMAVNARLSREQGLAMDEVKAQRYAAVALRRAGTPEEVAKAITYLAGPASGYVTGIALPVSGGVPCGI